MIDRSPNTIEPRPLVLVAGVPRASYDELAPVLDRQKLEIVQVTSAEDATRYAYDERVDLVLLETAPKEMRLEDFVAIIRAPTSASIATSLLVLAQPGSEDGALALVGRGVNRVMLATDPPRLIAQQVAALLKIAPRTTLRLGTRLLVELADGSQETLGAVVNMSLSGVLVETDADLMPGQHVAVTIDIGSEVDPITATAEVVRQAHSDFDGIEGVGIRFLKFAGDGKVQLERILSDAFGVSIAEIRTVS
jgi:hypothetical protein